MFYDECFCGGTMFDKNFLEFMGWYPVIFNVWAVFTYGKICICYLYFSVTHKFMDRFDQILF